MKEEEKIVNFVVWQFALERTTIVVVVVELQ